MTGADDTYVATVDELFRNFRAPLLALMPVADRAQINFRDEETHRDWERLAEACFDAFVRSPIDADRSHTGREFALARYDIDLADYLAASWLTVDESHPDRAAVVRLLSRGAALDTVQVVAIDPDTLRAGQRRMLPIDSVTFACYRRTESGSAMLISRVEAVD
jgi:hypothetical protein